MIRRELLNEVSRMTSNMYAALLAAKTTEERAAMFQRVNEIIWRLQNYPSVIDANGNREIINTIRDNRINAYQKFINNAMAIDEEDPAALKSLEVGIAFENSDLVKATEEYIALNHEDFRFVEQIAAEYAKTFGVSPDLANCLFAERAAKKELKTQITK